MATQQEINQITGLYVAYFNRAPDPAGLDFWTDQLDNGREFSTIAQDFAVSTEAVMLYPFLLNPATSSPTAFITSVYQNLFNRAPDQAGLDFWVGVLNSGNVPVGDMIEEILIGAVNDPLAGAFDADVVANKIAVGLDWTNSAKASVVDGEVFDYNNSAAASALSVVSSVNETQDSVDAAMMQTDVFFADGGEIVLEQQTVTVSPAVAATAVTQDVLYWGDGSSEGIPADTFLTRYLPAILGADLEEILQIDADVDQFPDFRGVTTISVAFDSDTQDDSNGGTLNLTFGDGTSDDIAISADYFDLLNDLIFDDAGNSRFFTQNQVAEVPVYVLSDGTTTTDLNAVTLPVTVANNGDPIGFIAATVGGSDAVTALAPVVLTQLESTQTDGTRTGTGNDVIQAGTLDILHNATIDGGPGENTLRVEAKGEFAQPDLLANIQQIEIENLPNIYTVDAAGPTPVGGLSNPDADSVIDLSTASQLVNVTITEGDYTSIDATANIGNLTVSGVSNNATVTFQGGFTNSPVNVTTSTGTTDPTFVLENVSADVAFNIGHNGAALTFASNGVSNNLQTVNSLSGSEGVTDLAITGAGSLLIQSDLDNILEDDSPVTINAAANSGGVDLNLTDVEQLTFVGSSASDRLAATTADTAIGTAIAYTDDQSITVTNGAGDNYYDLSTYRLSVTDGAGDNNVEFASAYANISAGDGNNFVQGSAAQAMVALGGGNNRVDLQMLDSAASAVFANISDFDQKFDITAGDGANTVSIIVDDSITTSTSYEVVDINITLGNGGNTINLPAVPADLSATSDALSNVNIVTGDGDDTMVVGGANITISSGGGNDAITLVGTDPDFVTAVDINNEFVASDVGALLNIDTGTGSATITLGADQNPVNSLDGAIVASTGSVITGNDITLRVDTNADLREATLSGITSIVLDDDSTGYVGPDFVAGGNAAAAFSAASLTLTDAQVIDLGSSVFSTEGEAFGAQSVVTIVVTQDADLSSIVNLSTWNPSVKLAFVVENNVTLTMTAEQLDKYVTQGGIYLVESGAGGISNNVVITDAGADFDAFNTGFEGGGTVQAAPGGAVNSGVTVRFSDDGYSRATAPGDLNLVVWNSDLDPTVDTTAYPFADTLEISGAADLAVNGGILLGNNADIDFSGLTGDFTDTTSGVPTVTILNLNGLTTNLAGGANGPADWGSIAGNGTATDPARVDFLVEDGSTVGQPGILDGGIPSTGVQQFVLTGFHTPVTFGPLGGGVVLPQSTATTATIYLCDSTEDVQVIGLQTNENAVVTFEQVNRNTDILLEGDGLANASDQALKNLGDPDVSAIGEIVVNYFTPGANAFVTINNQGTTLGLNEDAEDGFDLNGERVIEVEGITLTNADRLILDVQDGDATVKKVIAQEVIGVIATGVEDVNLVINGIIANPGAATSFDADVLDSIDGTNVAGAFTLTLTSTTDLSGVSLAGVDSIVLDGNGASITLTMTADQLVQYGSLIVDAEDGATNLIVEGMSTQALDLTAIDVDNITTVEFATGSFTVDAAANFGTAALTIPEDSNVTMTEAQFDTGAGNAPRLVEDGDAGNNAANNSLTLTDIPAGVAGETDVDVTNVATDVDVNIVLDGYTANADFSISGTGGEDTTLVLQGTTDLSAMPAASLGTVDAIEIADGATVTLTEAQVQALIAGGAAIEDVISSSGTATLNISEIDGVGINGTAALLLQDLVDANPGLSIGTLTLANEDTAVDLTGWQLAGATSIVTPTADGLFAGEVVEQTSLTLTMSQLLQLAQPPVISGDGTVNLTDVSNNNDSDSNNTIDNLLIDLSGIANAGTLTILEDGARTLNGETLTLDAATDLGGFSITLTDGQRIEFATEAQAATTVIYDNANTNPVAVVWLFTSVTAPVDTSGYDDTLDTLFVPETLVDGVNEENLWTSLPSGVNVEKFGPNGPTALIAFDRINTFQAFTSTTGTVTFDDQDEFETISALTLNLEGNVNLAGGVTIAETVGEAAFTALTINSYLDAENLPDGLTANGAGTAINGVTLQPNTIGDITLSAGVAADTAVVITVNTGQFNDIVNASGTTGQNGADTDEGQPVSIGAIDLGTPAAGVTTARLDLNGDNDITIASIDMSDPALTQVNIDVAGILGTTVTGADVTIGGVDYGALATQTGTLLTGGLQGIVMIDGLTATADTDLNPFATNQAVILQVSGTNDIKEVPVTAGTFAADSQAIGGTAVPGAVYVTAGGTLTMTGEQLDAIGVVDADNDGVADNWVLAPGVNPNAITINICDFDASTVDLGLIAAAGFNIGTLTISADSVLPATASLGGANEIIIEVGDTTDTNIALEMTAEQFNSFSGVITEQQSTTPLDPTATYTSSVIIDELEAIEVANGNIAEVDINLSTVTTTGTNSLLLSANGNDITATEANDAAEPGDTASTVLATGNPGDNDVILSTTTDLGNFAIVLNDVGGNAATDPILQLAGQTIRFATEVQADGRTVTVFGEDGLGGNGVREDTNVFWLFDALTAGNPGLDVSNYDEDLGRLIVSNDLVNSIGGAIADLFTVTENGVLVYTLDDDITERSEPDVYAPVSILVQANGLVLELAAGSALTSLTASIQDPTQYYETAEIRAGGLVTVGDIVIDDLIGTNVLGDNDFTSLEINSLLADHTGHFLLPDVFDAANDSLPSDTVQFPNNANTFGDIEAGTARGVLREVVINTGGSDAVIQVTSGAGGGATFDLDYSINGGAAITLATVAITAGATAAEVAAEIAAAIDAEPGVTAEVVADSVVVNAENGDVFTVTAATPAGFTTGTINVTIDGERGTDFVAQTISFSEDATPESPVGRLDVNGVNDVTLKGIDTTDAEIVTATIDTANHIGTLTVTGGSAAFTGGASTERLVIANNNNAEGVVNFGGSLGDDPSTPFTTETDFFIPTVVGGAVQAGIDGEGLSAINIIHGGTVNLGTIARIDGSGTNDDVTPGTDPNLPPAELFDDGFQMENNGSGVVNVTLGTAVTTSDGPQTPTLEAGGEWSFTQVNVLGELNLEINAANLGAGTLNLTGVNLEVTGDVDFTNLVELTTVNVTRMEVAEGGTLTLTVEQADQLELNGVTLFGEGTVAITGESSEDGTAATDATDTTFAHIRTGTLNLEQVTLGATDTDQILSITANGAEDDQGNPLVDANGDRVAQTIIGSNSLTNAINDAVTVTTAADDGDDTTIDVILALGSDTGNIGVPGQTPSTNTPTDATPEVPGDTIEIAGLGAPDIRVNVDSGFDQILSSTALKSSDVVAVSAGASFYAADIEGPFFTATADTTNDGIAVIETDGSGAGLETIDMSLAGGQEGWYLIGSDDNSSSTMTALIGSSQDDWFIDGTAFMNSNAGQTDVFTGGAGDDNFIFNLSNSDPAELAQTVTEIGLDEDTINVATAEALGNDNDDEVISILYELDGVSSTVVVDDPNIDFEDTASIAAGIAAALVAEGVNATATGSDVTVTDEVVGTTTRTGSGFEFQSASQNGNVTAAVATGITETANTANDVARTVEVTIDFTNSANPNQEAVAGEVYSLDITVPGQSTIEIDLLAPAGGEDALDIANAFLADLAFRSQAFVTGAVAGGSTALTATIVFTDNTPDDASGFSVDTAGSASGVISASSASSVLAGALSYTNAGIDVITDFETGADSITFGLDAGSATNYDDGVVETDFDAARMAADAAFAADADLVYFVNSVAGATDPVENGTYLFVNFNGLASGGTADTVVQMTGIGISDIAFGDIV
jgi:hypothetical protein